MGDVQDHGPTFRPVNPPKRRARVQERTPCGLSHRLSSFSSRCWDVPMAVAMVEATPAVVVAASFLSWRDVEHVLCPTLPSLVRWWATGFCSHSSENKPPARLRRTPPHAPDSSPPEGALRGLHHRMDVMNEAKSPAKRILRKLVSVLLLPLWHVPPLCLCCAA
jgi:hypothetical protein